jgi:hypothetical protein
MIETPMAATCAAPGASRCVWGQNDIHRASVLDWNVEGATYGFYNAAVGNTPADAGGFVNAGTTGAPSASAITLGLSLSIGARSDIDNDTVTSSVCLWRARINTDGSAAAGNPACTAGTSTTNCGGAATSPKPNSAGWGQVVGCSADNVF